MSIEFSKLEFSEDDLLGEGFFGQVFRGRHNGDLVAIKKVNYASDKDEYSPLMKGIIESQAEKLSVMKHENLVEFRGYAKKNGLYYLVWKFLKAGGNLRKFIKKRKERIESGGAEKTKFGIMEKINLSLQICRALKYFHRNGFIHGDIRPKNVLLDTLVNSQGIQYTAKVIDFGLPRSKSKDFRECYYGPELKSGLEVAKKKESDMYGLAMTLWCVFNEKFPENIGFSQPLFPRKNGGSAEDQIMGLMKKCIDRRVAKRPRIGEVVKLLEKVMESENVKVELERKNEIITKIENEKGELEKKLGQAEENAKKAEEEVKKMKKEAKKFQKNLKRLVEFTHDRLFHQVKYKGSKMELYINSKYLTLKKKGASKEVLRILNDDITEITLNDTTKGNKIIFSFSITEHKTRDQPEIVHRVVPVQNEKEFCELIKSQLIFMVGSINVES